MKPAEVIVVGGGIVGLATAWQTLCQRPDTKLLVLEKEEGPGRHQTSHNSGVLHTGVYYAPGSLKAQNCVAGRKAMVEFCEEHGIAFEVCGKVIVATREAELPRLEQLHERATANGVRCELIGPEQLAELEPHAAGLRALRVPDAGIADFPAVAHKLADLIQRAGGEVHTGVRVTRVREDTGEIAVETTKGAFAGQKLVSCAGLHADRVTRLSGRKPPAKIVPFRGEYYEFVPDAPRLCHNLIYPVPDPAFPFLGVHLTRTVEGPIHAGPNAVLALAREGYKRSKIDLQDLFESLTYPGFLRLALRYWRTGAGEMRRSASKSAFVGALQRLVPEVRAEHLSPAPAGVRAQAVRPDGGIVDDFLVVETNRMLHVLNAPSPAATASLSIGASLAEKLIQR